MAKTLTTELRFGWTTGTCATAATYGAYMALISGEFPQSVIIDTPSGKSADLALSYTDQGKGWAEAGVIKDAGDDPDVTHGAEIRAKVESAATGSGIQFKGGEGVGLVTKAGLPVDVGDPAINPVPRQMMRDCIANLAAETGGTQDVVITVSVPNGAELATKTWNPRLGIEGGISILGTTGVVRPFSCSAWIASIHRGIDVARANGIDHVAGSTGATSEKAVQSRYDLPETALLDMGDFVGGVLKYLRRHPVPRLTIAGGFAKMVKLAQGHSDLHSARSQIDFTALARLASPAGFDFDEVRKANTALEILQQADDAKAKALGHLIATQALKEARQILRQDAVAIDVMIITRDGTILAEAN
jgi:cobalt-precorrin-5B (C1)-methyltransferase